ncbi:hypothetical protein F5J12DRAFT_928613 [Pisolithus orientalis]|uniref:uncharacterized protein n=1 Tax=Pisolithus orientalis TaxID=936130 RepID=UPI0022247C8A|nr:uncharacterized protein F5J12DRAFT_928613 [Pisolithus orientalis]KAI5999749.1 hypothetical protein F5J12DRAFT_928613 [Pisolithus orientalis]
MPRSLSPQLSTALGEPLRWHFPDPTYHPTSQLDCKELRYPTSEGTNRHLTYPYLFVLRHVEGDIYTLTTNGMQVIELEGKVFAVVEGRAQEWVIRYRELQDAYTIVKRLDEPGEIGWIAPTDDKSPQISVGPLQQTPTAPPGYLETELYRFKFPSE